MRTLVALLFLTSAAGAAELPVRACVKWSKDIPEAQAAGAGLFKSLARVEGKGPFADCDVVTETETFGVGWLMRAYMKQAVLSPCGKRLGGYKFGYKGDKWQEKMVVELHKFLAKNPEALSAAKDCPAVAVPPVAVTTEPPTPPLPVEPVVPSTSSATTPPVIP
ncbi:MAG: hypothetical protein HY923_00925 [Elusimicrobia bacterium]|nr:hypothetical protein [Elusimicrobiota bacterium]